MTATPHQRLQQNHESLVAAIARATAELDWIRTAASAGQPEVVAPHADGLMRELETARDLADKVAADADLLVTPAETIELPKYKDLRQALDGKACLRTCLNWTSGTTSPPAWAVVAAADALRVDAGALARAFVGVRK